MEYQLGHGVTLLGDSPIRQTRGAPPSPARAAAVVLADLVAAPGWLRQPLWTKSKPWRLLLWEQLTICTARGQFLADVAHEIATPVNALAGFALALADGAAEDSQQRAEAKALIESQTGRLGNLLGDLRELTPLDLAEGVKPGPLALAPFAEALVGGFRRDAAAAGIELTLSVRGDEAFTDGRLLEIVGSNLISSAIRYTPSGGRVDVRLHRQRDRVLLSVRDTGVGIAPEHQQRVFERLYRVDSTRDRATGGPGLGLAIASRAARSLGGYIELDSMPGKGSEFRAIVPA